MLNKATFKRFSKVLLINLLGVALLILLIEVAFSFNPKATLQKETYFNDRAEKYRYEHQNISSPWQLPNEVAMPYFGYGLDQNDQNKTSGLFENSDSYQINNYKFRSSLDYPYVKKDDEVVIGVFGGSFAFNWVVYENRVGEFARKLPGRIASLKGKKIILLNMSQSGYKQPQQFFVFAYFYEMLDAAIMIDGLNEISLSTPASFPLEFPIYSARFYTMAPNKFSENLAQHSRNLREVLRRIISLPLLHTWLTKSYLYYVFDSSMIEFLKNRIVANNAVLRSGPRLDSFYKKDFTFEEKLALAADVWTKYTAMTHDLALKNKIQMFHYLQPNQYLGAKPLSAFELKNSFDEKAKPHVEMGFSLLLNRQKQLAAKNYNVSTQLMKAYANETGDLYIDDCCHVNDAGNAVLTLKILELVAADWR